MTHPYTQEQSEEDIANLRGQVDKMTEIIQTATIQATATTALPTVILTDTWHSLGALTGFSVQKGRYRLTPHNEVQIDVQVTAGGSNLATVTFANQLGALYLPLDDRLLPLGSNRNVTAGDTWPRLFVNHTTGDVQVITQASTVAIIGGTYLIPLD